MDKSKADLILHPVRMRIIQVLITGEDRTTGQIAELLSNIPQATLYRHLNTLLKAGLLDVVEERKIRGTVEKVYALSMNASDLTPDDVTELSSENHMELFLKHVASLIGEFGKYVGQEHYNLSQDGVTFRQIQLYLNDDDYMDLLEEMKERYQKHADNGPGEGRRRRLISMIVIPEAGFGQQTTDEGDKSHEYDSPE